VRKLRLEHPEIGARIVELGDAGLIVGRDGAIVDLPLDWDRRISRRHARLTLEGEDVFVEDLESKNGTWDGDRKIRRAQLVEGGCLIVGETAFTLWSEAPVPKDSALDDMMAAYVAGTDDLPVPERGVTPPPTPVIVPPVIPAPVLVPEPMRPAPVGALPEPKDVTRSHPRFVAEKRVGLRVDARSELRTLWMENISKGGLFVRSNTPLPRGTIVDVEINTPDGDLLLRAEVVHVATHAIADASGTKAGVGLAFTNLGPEQREAIHRYVDGLADRLATGQATGDIQAMPAQTAEQMLVTLARAKELIVHAENNDLYKAIGVVPTASLRDITARLDALKNAFQSAYASATPPQLARLSAAMKLVERTGTLMSSPERRLEYDFRHGEARADQRMEQARQKMGPTIAELRGAWARAFPERIEKSMALAKQSFELRKAKDLIGAVRAGRQALELDPFLEELRTTVRAWSEMISPVKKD
jgi:uncharacterized protein (TIGR02266 family)